MPSMCGTISMMTEMRARSSGIYGLVNCNGAPVAIEDAGALGMPVPIEAASWQIEGHDPHSPGAVQHHSDADGKTLLVGEIAAPSELAARLGLSKATPIARIAAAALARFGVDTPAEMLGEWSLLHRSSAGALTLMIGPAIRDRVHYAAIGPRVAVSPDLFRLARIDWIGRELDEAGLLLRWGRTKLRAGIGARTMLARVQQLEAGQSVVIQPGGSMVRSSASALVPQPRWHGTFTDAVEQSEALLRTIMAERLAGGTRAALLLSGGLDSSLLAWLAAEERGDDQAAFAITSAAPADSGITDETSFAMLVAKHIGLDCVPTCAAPEADFFRPSEAIIAGASGPILSNRHCLTEAFQIAAKAQGATRMINGTYGEMTATARLPDPSLRATLRRQAARTWHALRRRDLEPAQDNPFHVRIAPHRLANLSEQVTAARYRHPSPQVILPRGDGLLGYLPGATKALTQPNEFYPGALRMDFPFRDIRLLRLFAGFPLAILVEGGADRPIVRAMLEGRLPDAIRLRRRGMPAEPDRYLRMQRQAAGARARITLFRKAGVDAWIDLDWLDQALGRVAARGAASNQETNEVQLTAIAAEFLLWWQQQG